MATMDYENESGRYDGKLDFSYIAQGCSNSTRLYASLPV